MLKSNLRKCLLTGVTLAFGFGQSAFAQAADVIQAPSPEPQQSAPEEPTDRVVVVGSQIVGAETTGALPVTVVGAEAIAATGAVSAEELFRTIPQAGDITFNGTYLGGGNSNAARGDVSTVSLRGLAQGNTLMLINGRRSVLHPTSQTDNQTPVFGYNSNAVPVQGLARVEVLKDGAAALYGSDAVAGVVNNVLRDDFEGLNLDFQYGLAEGTNMEEFTGSVLYGTDFADGRGNISLFAGYTDRTALLRSDQAYTASADLRSFVAGTPWANASSANGLTAGGPWGVFTPTPTISGGVRSNGVLFTDASGAFHTQPSTGFGSAVVPSATQGVAFGPGVLSGVTYNNMRVDSTKSFPDLTTQPALNRLNLFGFANYDLTDNLRLYGEAGFYKAQTKAVIGPGGSLASGYIYVAPDAYYNPLGSGPNRLPNLTGVPAEGVPLRLTTYTIYDGGTREVVVDNDQYRLLAGLKGDAWGWDWDSAVLYSEANVKDAADGYSSTLFQQAINRTDATAYNPFNGGNATNPLLGDTTLSNQDAIDSFSITQVRKNKTSLLLMDFKVSKPDLFTYWAGDIGVAAGIEWRRDTYHDDRDSRQDTSTWYYNQVPGITSSVVNGVLYPDLVSTSDLMGHSPSPDVKGDRNTTSAYIEFAVPLVNPDWNIPAVASVDLQVAGRYEDYSDVGSVAKPKVAAVWDTGYGLKVRGSWSEGFKAPNLEVVNTPLLERLNSYPDYIQAEAQVRAGNRATYADCTAAANRPTVDPDYANCRAYSVQVASLRSGNPNLKPEESTSYSYGVVYEPEFLPEWAGDFTFMIDRWSVEQENVIGLLTDDVALNYDYFLRLQGSSNPLVIRSPATPQQIAEYAGTGLAPAGDVQNVIAAFTNLAPLTVEGIDYGVTWGVDVGPGRFNMNANGSFLDRYEQSPTTEGAILTDAKAAGQINPLVSTSGMSYGGSQVEEGGRPKWKYSINADYTIGNWQFGYFMQYTGHVYQRGTGTSTATGVPWKVQQQWTSNAHVSYAFDQDSGWAQNMSLRVGVRNLFNEDPPFAFGDTGGYLSSLYQPYPRYWYVNVKKSF